MRVGTLVATTIGLLLTLAVLGIGAGLIADVQLGHDRDLLLNELDPALRAALALESALVDEETGVRGYLIAPEPAFLQPYESGLEVEARAYADLKTRAHAAGPKIASEVETVSARARMWRAEYVTPALRTANRPVRSPLAANIKGKRLFDAIRASLTNLRAALTAKTSATHDRLNRSARTLEVLLIVAGALILGGILAAGLLLRLAITRPLGSLGAEARRVASGRFAKPLEIAVGPREISDLGAEIDAMRERIVAELAVAEAARAELEEQAGELSRSNTELEQFAYVASHDLQEPLRKITSFCQALQSRYQGQLDDRADQYIEFAVDGAKRMQTLINDLLAFSRVGRSGREPQPIELADVLDAAIAALSDSLESTGASVRFGALPTVNGDRALLISLFQNLIGNAVKFCGAGAPVVQIDAVRREDEWEFNCSDNGIGIEPEYAERIFLIFQRLHSREAYEGSGIGLALCRKIVEQHGGRIWLDASTGAGACFRFTLPIAEEAT
jgi:signal transduction histidine kinase